ncbi:high affinity copper uptake protein 1-like [Euwallacea fornicatus]|uniref:high affinity copper uptake protein 1-like n=1 Tax=Euwallacea fornicatus TaxID=995702 RepID=UPI00338E32CA
MSHDGHDDHHDHSGHDGHEMNTYFIFSKSATVLFKQWNFDSVGGLIASVFAIYVMAFLYEALKFLRAYLLAAAVSIKRANKCSGGEKVSQPTIMSKSHLIQTLLHGVQGILGYFLMLIFMTYNGWLCIAVIGGFVCGYFVFAWRMSCAMVGSANDDHCQ